jgi:predicted secreted protein
MDDAFLDLEQCASSPIGTDRGLDTTNGDLRMRRLLGLTAATLIAVGAPIARAEIDTGKVGPRIAFLAAMVGNTDILASVCGARDEDWVDALENEFMLDATKPDIRTATANEIALESRFADSQLEKVKAITRDRIERQGVKVACPDLKTTIGLGLADQMVKEWRKPKDLSGFGGIK